MRRYRLHVTVDIDSDAAPNVALLEDAARQLADGLKESDAFPDLALCAEDTHAVYFVGHGVEDITEGAHVCELHEGDRLHPLHVTAICPLRIGAWVDHPVNYEARCLSCGEVINPSLRVEDLDDDGDVVHYQREDGVDCGGKAVVTGWWG